MLSVLGKDLVKVLCVDRLVGELLLLTPHGTSGRFLPQDQRHSCAVL